MLYCKSFAILFAVSSENNRKAVLFRCETFYEYGLTRYSPIFWMLRVKDKLRYKDQNYCATLFILFYLTSK